MLKNSFSIITCLSIFVLAACSDIDIKCKPLILFDALEGEWFTGNDSIIYYETWHKSNDTVYLSTAYSLKGNDTLFKENVKIIYGEVVKEYKPIVNNQNGAQPVTFKIVELTDSGFIASNPLHDFPNTINYSLKKDSLIAFIEGNSVSGNKQREYFRMIRK